MKSCFQSFFKMIQNELTHIGNFNLFIETYNNLVNDFYGPNHMFCGSEGNLMFWVSKDYPNEIDVNLIKVHKNLRRRGICRKLIEYMINFVKNSDKFKKIICCSVENKDLQKLLETYGFIVILTKKEIVLI